MYKIYPGNNHLVEDPQLHKVQFVQDGFKLSYYIIRVVHILACKNKLFSVKKLFPHAGELLACVHEARKHELKARSSDAR